MADTVKIDPQTGERIEPGAPQIDPATGERISVSAEHKDEPGYMEGLKAGVQGMWNTVRHPIDTAMQMGQQLVAGGMTPYGVPINAPTGNQQRDEANQQVQEQARQEMAQQGKFLGEHPAYTAGMLTPTAVMAAAGAAAPRLAPAIARVSGKALLLGKTPEAAYESALKPSTTLSPSARATIAQTGLKEGIPVSKGGLEKIGDLIDTYNQKIADTINKDPNRPIDPNAIAARSTNTVNRFSNQVNATPDLNAIEASKQQFLQEQGARPGSPAPPMGAAKAQAMKQGTYRVLRGKFGEQGSAAVEIQKELAHELKEEIATQFPEINELNASESNLLNLKPAMERAVNRISNHQAIGIGTPIAGAAAKAVTGSGGAGVVMATLKAVLDNPAIKSKLAIAVSKGGKMPYATAAARVAAYSSALGSAVQSPGSSDQSSAENAQP